MSGHLSQEELLRHLDGELAVLEEMRVSSHLCACWSCQAELERMKCTIIGIIDAQTTILDPTIPPPPAPWPRLEPRFEREGHREPGRSPAHWLRFHPRGRSLVLLCACLALLLGLIAYRLVSELSGSPNP